MANCGDPLIRFADNTVINLREAVSVHPSSFSKDFISYTVMLSSGESFTIYNEEYEESSNRPQMLYDNFVDKWYWALRPPMRYP